MFFSHWNNSLIITIDFKSNFRNFFVKCYRQTALEFPRANFWWGNLGSDKISFLYLNAILFAWKRIEKALKATITHFGGIKNNRVLNFSNQLRIGAIWGCSNCPNPTLAITALINRYFSTYVPKDIRIYPKDNFV